MNEAQTLDVLALAYALLRDSNWYRARVVNEPSECGLTALQRAFEEFWPKPHYRNREAWERRMQVFDGLNALVCSCFSPSSPSLPHYNDAPGRKKSEVLRVFERAAAKVGKG